MESTQIDTYPAGMDPTQAADRNGGSEQTASGEGDLSNEAYNKDSDA